VVVSPAPADAGLSDPSHDDRPPASRIRLILAAALAVVSLVCAGLLVWQLSAAEDGSQVQDSREEAMSLTDQFVKRLGSYGPEMLDDSGQMPQYREQVGEVITDKFRADFEEQVDTVEQLVAQAGVERQAAVFATGVSSIDDDSARVLVAGSFTDVYTQGTGDRARTIEQEPLPFRFTVDLVKIEGEWLVDDFTPAGSDGAAGGSPQPGAPAPTGVPSEGPTDGSTEGGGS
jgi:Mce-associated membrane protein